ncbi:predicted protein [Cyanophage PSS2]|nr:predicted protein [Cyanophage PSS2]
MKYRHNVDPEDPTSMLRLISEIEGVSTLLPCFDDMEDEIAFVEAMKRKCYKLYFKMVREAKEVRQGPKLDLELDFTPVDLGNLEP